MAARIGRQASPVVAPNTYRVFLSFRGKDTRKNFTDHLYTALKYAGIHTFRDDDGIERGEDIRSEIKKAIHNSEMSIVIFSKDYASSEWCLDELLTIMEQRRSVGHVVLPVFYDLNPSEVAEQSGSFKQVFGEYESVFMNDKGRVNLWRAALKEVAALGGMVLRDRSEAEFIQEIVRKVSDKLNRTILHTPTYLVGIESRVEDINIWLQDGSEDVSIAVIYGIGGIGKTTIAKTVYNQNYDKFEGHSFLANVRETSEQFNGLLKLQKQLLSNILKGREIKVYNAGEGLVRIKEAVKQKKVLIVLDDVDDIDQFNSVLGMKDWLYPGSKIIITTRHECLLKEDEVCRKFKVKELDDKESLQLFSWHAFGQDYPTCSYMEHSESVVEHCGGLPVALQILGSCLSGRSISLWKQALREPESIDDGKMQRILRISYDALLDDRDRSLFLDIACFFIGKDKIYVDKIIEGCGFYRILGIQNLLDRYLITIDEHNKLMMHQSLRDMAREIVRQESPEELGERSRLWCHKDAFAVLIENSGTENIRCLTLDENPMEIISEKKVKLGTRMFTEMRRLKFLQLNCTTLAGSYKNFPKSLLWLSWHGFPLVSIPANLKLEKLIILELRYGKLEHAWQGIKALPKLKILDLSHSHLLVRTPNFTGVTSLERLILEDCINLLQIDESLGVLKKLIFFSLKDCNKLKLLSSTIGKLESLETLILSGCSKLDELPMEFANLKSLKMLYADGMGNNQSCSTIGEAKKPSLFSLPFLPCSLVKLSLEDCKILDLPSHVRNLGSLEYLNLGNNPISTLPESVKKLAKLKALLLDRCDKLRSLPELPSYLEELNLSGCYSLQRITNLPNLLTSLRLVLSGCHKLVEVQELFKLEPIGNNHKEMINCLKLFDSESLETKTILLRNDMVITGCKSPIQILHECGIFSIFVPGSNVPDWYSYQNTSSEISFTVPQLLDHRTYGLNLCIVSGSYRRVSKGLATIEPKNSPYTIIRNKTKGWKRIYSPMFYPEKSSSMDYTDVLWLSHWKMGGLLQTGDRMTVSVITTHKIHVKMCGVHVVEEWNNEGDCREINSCSHDSSLQCQSLDDAYVSAYQISPQTYFLCNWQYKIHQKILHDGPNIVSKYPLLSQAISGNEHLSAEAEAASSQSLSVLADAASSQSNSLSAEAASSQPNSLSAEAASSQSNSLSAQAGSSQSNSLSAEAGSSQSNRLSAEAGSSQSNCLSAEVALPQSSRELDDFKRSLLRKLRRFLKSL